MSSSINKQIYLTKSCFEDLIPKRCREIKMHLDSNFQRQNIDQRSKNIYIYIYIYIQREIHLQLIDLPTSFYLSRS